MTDIAPSPRVAGIGPQRTDRPEWAACRERTDDEWWDVVTAISRRARRAGRRSNQIIVTVREIL